MSLTDRITTVVLDWAGTTVDFGCFAPVDAFISAFEAFGITPTLEETRAPMGLPKRDHIMHMISGRRISELWHTVNGRVWEPQDVDRIYEVFEPALFATIEKHAQPLPDVVDTIAELRERGLRIGSTTGYTKAMMEVVAPLAQSYGYAPDTLVCPDDTGGVGRPFPYMLWRNARLLQAARIQEVIKAGDTEADIAEGLNAGCRTVGIIKGSSLLGLSLDEYDSKTDEELRALHEQARKRYYNAGADHVLDTFSELPGLLLSLEREETSNVPV